MILKVLRFSFLISLISLSSVFAQQKNDEFTPPGTVATHGFYFDEYEVSNLAWAEYLFYLKRDSTFPQYVAALPDTTVWYNIFPQDMAEDYMINYLYDESSRNFPVVGISYWQASDYCYWRSTVVNKQLENSKSSKRVNYRLPTPAEWEKVALSTASYNLDDISIPRERIAASFDRSRMRGIRDVVVSQNPEVDRRLNLNELQEDLINFFMKDPIYLFENLYFEEVPYFWPVLRNGQKPLEITYGDLTIKNLRGNVSEMTSVRNVAKGGNWTTTPEESEAQYDLIYNSPSALVGFRCVCDVTEVPKKVEDPDDVEWDDGEK